MKKIVLILTIILASIGCKKEKCLECTISIYQKGLGWYTRTEVNCDDMSEMLRKTVFITIDPLTGEILFERDIICK